jgi:transketolase
MTSVRIESVSVARSEFANALRFLAIDPVEAAKSGHPGNVSATIQQN